MPVLRPSTATTPGRTATATSGSAPLSQQMPEGAPPCAARPAQNAKGLMSLGRSPKQPTTCPRPLKAGADQSLFEQIYDFENLFCAWLRARAGKRGQRNIAKYHHNLESELIQLQNELMWGVWEPGCYESFEIHEPKTRWIYAPAFRDRVLHHSLVAALTPRYERVFIHNSFACRVGKGAHAGATAAESAIRKTVRKHGKAYALKADVRKYFESIDRAVMKSLLRQRIGCASTLAICDRIIDHVPGLTGLPLGNLTSQLFANIYLHELDHHMVNICGVSQYFRYMDDWVVIGHDKAYLQHCLGLARAKLDDLSLELNPKTAIFPICSQRGRSVDFLGYQLYGSHRRLRQRSRRKGFAYARNLAAEPSTYHLDRLTSWYAHARHAEPTGIMRTIFSILSNN